MSPMWSGDPGPLLSSLGPASHLLTSPQGDVCTVDIGRVILCDQQSLWPYTLTQNSRETSWTTSGAAFTTASSQMARPWTKASLQRAALPAALRYTRVLEAQGGTDLSCLRQRKRRRKGSRRGPGHTAGFREREREGRGKTERPFQGRVLITCLQSRQAGGGGGRDASVSILVSYGGRVRQWPRALGLCVETSDSVLDPQLCLDPGTDLFLPGLVPPNTVSGGLQGRVQLQGRVEQGEGPFHQPDKSCCKSGKRRRVVPRDCPGDGL